MPHIGRAISVEAPAKLNLHLQVGDRRPDGFHAIESLFIALAFGDVLHFETVPQPLSLEIAMHWHENLPVLAIPPEENIVFRAVSLFRDRTGYDCGLKVTIEKHIPPGGGMGGGSSDAAATLLALNRLVAPDGCGLDEPALAEMGAFLGSDVPFFLHEHVSAAWVSGRGEQIQPLTLPESFGSLSFVLVNPGFPSDTAEAYRLLDQRRGTGDWGLGTRDCCSQSKRLDNPLCLLTNLPSPQSPVPSPHNWSFTNDFLPVLTGSDKGTVYQKILDSLRECGADFAGLSGSGSTCFGVFIEKTIAQQAKSALLKRWPFVINTFFLEHN